MTSLTTIARLERALRQLRQTGYNQDIEDSVRLQEALAALEAAVTELPAPRPPQDVQHDTGAPMQVKQVLVVRKDLAMPVGKVAAQAAHGASNALVKDEGAYIAQTENGAELRIPLDAETKQWLDTDYRKIVVAVNSEEALLKLYKKARQAGLRCHLVQDNGLTVFDGQKTYTALALGPHDERRLDPLTKRLQLLR
jgi:peptidyl-tRNA hydrolase, PTH2 family